MFALIRHAPYAISTGSLTPEGIRVTRSLAEALKKTSKEWQRIHTSPSPRAVETGQILSEILGIPLELDARLSTEGDFADLLPPTEPQRLIFVSHLPVLTRMLRTWCRTFREEEPPLTEVGHGYLIDPTAQTIIGIHPSKRA